MNKLDKDTPLQARVLLWFVGNNAPRAAHTWVIGEVSAHEPGKIWDGQRYRPSEWFTHWMPLPEPPLLLTPEEQPKE